MINNNEKFPKPVNFLPDHRLSISDLQGLEKKSSTRRIWIPRYVSGDDIDSDAEDVLDLSIGLIPKTGIESFVVEWKGHIVSFEFTDNQWQITNATDRDEIDPQILTYQMKSYATLHRVRHKWELENQSNVTD